MQSSSFYVKKLFNFCSQKRSKVWFSLQITFLMCYHHKKIPWDEYPFPHGTIFFFKDPSPKMSQTVSLIYIPSNIYVLVYWFGRLGLFVCLFYFVCMCVWFCFFVFGFFGFFLKADHESLISSNKYVNCFSNNKNDLRIARVSILVLE